MPSSGGGMSLNEILVESLDRRPNWQTVAAGEEALSDRDSLSFLSLELTG